jgi:WD40 repeat protein/predicted Ser/Thr protein kinase
MDILNKRYCLIQQLGRGGMGVVYKATDMLLGHRFVALKEMDQRNVDPQNLADALASFKREALILARLSHPNLPRIYDYFEERGNAYLVMDFIDGETLHDLRYRAPGQKLGIEDVLQMAEQLCSALAYLHAMHPPIIFRDIKPSNIMITSKEQHLYLIDFGIARFFKPRQPKDTRSLGTEGYAAPEQYLTQSSTSSDIYSLGVTLHELLTGLDPTKAKTPHHFPSLREYNPQVPLSLDALILQMLDVQPSRRPATVTAIRQQLRQIYQRSQNMAYVQTPGTSGVQILTTSGIQSPGIQPPTTPGIQPPATPAIQTPATPPGIQITKKLRAVLGSSATQPRQGPRQGATIYTYRQHTDDVSSVAWSPDGNYLVSGSKDKTVQVWEASTGRTTLTYSNHMREVCCVAWSPLGDRIASSSFGAVHIWSVASGECFLQYHEHDSWVHAVVWSPASFAMASCGADRKVSLWETRKGDVLRRYPGFPGAVRAIAWFNDAHTTKLLAGCEDANLYCWEVTNPSKPLTYRGHIREVTCVAWSPDGQKCVSGSGDKTVKIWDVATGHTLNTYQGHSGKVYTVAWSPDGTRIASAGQDKSVCIWDAATGKTLSTYRGHTDDVYAIAWSPDGTRIASASADKTVHVWH